MADFFNQVTSQLVGDLFRRMRFDARLVEILVGLLTLRGRLPQGAPTSSAIADLVLKPVDEQVHAAAQRLGVRVTRYVDDFAFSGLTRDGLPKLRAVIGRELRTVGLAANHSKDTLTGRGRRQVVHGLVVNGSADGRLSIPKEYRKALERDIYRANVFGINRDHAESLPSLPTTMRHLTRPELL